MGSNQPDLEEYAETLYTAYDTKSPVEPITQETDLTTEEAYEIQSLVVEKIRASGTAPLGHKLGLVSKAKQEQLGIQEPIYGHISEENRLAGEPIPASEMISPRLEAEIGFLLDEDIPAPVSPTDVMTATRAVVPVVEIIESRFKDWTIPTAQDVIADNTSTARLAVGDRLCDVSDVDLRMEGLTVSVDGELEATGVGADIMGHPARAVSWLGNRLDDTGDKLQEGELVMSGGISAAIDIEPGDVFHVEFGTIGSMELRAE